MTTAIKMQSIVARNDALITGDIDGELVMMSMVAGQYYSLDPIGTRIWNLLESEARVSDLCSALSNEFAVTEAQCEEDVLSFLDELLQHDIVNIKP